MRKGFGIQEYHDVKDIYERIGKLVDNPIRPIRREEMEKYIEGFSQKYASSKPVIDEAKNFIPGKSSTTRPVDYAHNKQIRELCDKYGALLIFDEVVTAFLIGLSGAQGPLVSSTQQR